ncbi:MAG TPA: ABC-2 transporter permease [Sedimentisphaerales bacterium]|nr:ABC-2 transporter permease [Sedimentisphaerales bacterium]
MKRLFTIALNTFTETIRQPIYAIIICSALIMLTLSPYLTMYSMSDDSKLLREIGLSTLFLTSLFIAIFAASGALAEEIENKTIITVLSKPVNRPTFVIAKFLGVTTAVALAHYICSIALLITIRDGVLESASDTHDWVALGCGIAIIVIALILSTFFNFSYDWKFSSSAIVLSGILGTLGIIVLAFIDENCKFNPAANGINSFDILGSLLLFLAALIIVALAIAFSTRFNIAVTLALCIGIFLLGLISDHVFGKIAESDIWIQSILAQGCRFIIPNLQVFWISDAIYEESVIPLRYIGISAFYALSYTSGVLLFAIALFQKRQVG